MIRTSSIHDLNELKIVWKRCFTDSDEFVDTFVQSLWSPDHCLVVELDHRIVSMLFLLPATVQFNGEYDSLYYIYACATDPDYRRLGLMNRLLDQAYSQACQRGIAALTLVPADEALKHYYGKCGFSPCSTRKILTIEPNQLPAPPQELGVERLTPALLQQLRNNLLPGEGVVEWPLSHLSVEMEADEAPQSGGVWVEERGTLSYAVYTTHNNELHLKEFGSNAGNRTLHHLSALVHPLSFDRLTAVVHPLTPLGTINHGNAMIRPTANWNTKSSPEGLFLNLCLSE